jgi:hypothetical protein
MITIVKGFKKRKEFGIILILKIIIEQKKIILAWLISVHVIFLKNN